VDLWRFEILARKKGYTRTAGIDEAGRGPLAGPVIAAAVILPEGFHAPGLTDSKKVPPGRRDYFYDQILSEAVTVGIGIASHVKIDRVNILRATKSAMADAVRRLNPLPDHLMIDGNQLIDFSGSQEAIVGGDGLSISIAAASIVAKVFRDRIMSRYDRSYPEYGFFQHKGYATESHRESIRIYGPCAIHRKSFSGVKEYLPAIYRFGPLFSGAACGDKKK
jgi:ribonuclease HII